MAATTHQKKQGGAFVVTSVLHCKKKNGMSACAREIEHAQLVAL